MFLLTQYPFLGILLILFNLGRVIIPSSWLRNKRRKVYYIIKRISLASDFRKIVNYWREEYSSNIERSRKYEMPAQLNRMASMAAPGESFYYIANFHNLELEMLSDSIEKFLDLPPEDVDMNKILSLADSEDVERIQLKEKVAKSFFIDFLAAEDVMEYKVQYTYNLRDSNNRKRLMLHQACALTVNASGRFVHVFSIHSDISHLTAKNTDDISFISLGGGQSYLNIFVKNGSFDPQCVEVVVNLQKLLSEREKEILSKFSQGLSSEEVAKELFISINTVQTHRKNMLRKSKARNSIELISRCITAGVIAPSF